MATATATRTTDDAPVVTGGASHGLLMLAQKLQHPLMRIRARALANLSFKLRERLVDVPHESSQAIDRLMQALVANVAEKELEAGTLQVLKLLLLDSTVGETVTQACAVALRRHGAATAFQRGGLNGTAETQAIYETLLHRLLATSAGVQEAPSSAVSSTSERMMPTESLASSAVSLHDRTVSSPAVRTANATTSASRQAHRLSNNETTDDPLTRQGWHFPRVTLAAVDDQFLFEFEVKWRLRTSVPEIVEMCDTFRRELLRDYPAEVFLQRPSMLLCVLELVRQPIVPASTTPELSFGVNYFDEPASVGSFVWKPSVLATALHVSALKAIESWLAAVRYSMDISLNPMYHTFQSSSSVNNLAISTSGFDHRRLHYPRLLGDGDSCVRDEDSGLSLSGAAYLIAVTLVRLLSSENYPHLHLLNLIRIATTLLPDRSISHRENTVNHLDKTRFEALFAALGDFIRVAEDGVDVLTTDAIVEWVVGSLQLLDSSSFRVQSTLTSEESNHEKIEIPALVWNWLLCQLASRQTRQHDYVRTTIQFLDQVDMDASSKLREYISSNEYSTQLAAALNGDSSTGTLPLALQILRAVSSLSEQERRAGVRIVLGAVCKELEHQTTGSDASGSNEVLANVLTQSISLFTQENPEHCHDFGIQFFDGVIDWMVEVSSPAPSERLKAVLTVVSVSDEFFRVLLCCLAGSGIQSKAADTLWRLIELLLRGSESETSNSSSITNALVKLSVILQHLAYTDSSTSTANDAHRRMQRTLMHVAHRIEPLLPASEKLLFVSRCVLHRSPVVRRAAASGLLDQLRQLVPHRLDKVALNSVVSVDPFGQLADITGDKQRRVIEHEISSILQPRVNNGDYYDSGSTISSGRSASLNRISRLRKLLSSLMVTRDDEGTIQGAVASTLQQLMIDLAHAHPLDFSILQESGEVEELMHLAIRLLPGVDETEPRWIYSVRASSLSIVRLLLTRSPVWRHQLRQDTKHLAVLLSFVFDEEPRVRAEAYFIVLVLSCSLELVTLQSSPSGLVVPAEFSTTFGLFSERWAVSGVATIDIMAAVKQPLSNKDEVAVELSTSLPNNTTQNDSVQRLCAKLSSAGSFRTFLDAVYAAIHACHARRDVCVEMSTRWEETSFRRYLETTPTSAKDQVVMAAILALLNVLYGSMAMDQQMDVIVLLRNKVIPLHLVRGQGSLNTASLPAQLSRLLVRINRSPMAHMFVPLLIDTGLVKSLSSLIVASGVSGFSAQSQQCLWIQVVLEALESTRSGEGYLSNSQELRDAVLLPFQAIAARHHVPGSFLEHNSYANAVSCLMRLMASDSDSNWRGRLLFDTISSLRSTGFQVAALTLGKDDHDATARILRLATDTMRDNTESDAVRCSATDLLHDFYRRVESDALPLYSSSVDGERFVPNLINDLVRETRIRERCGVRLTFSRVQLLRFFVGHRDRFARTPYGNTLELISGTNDECRVVMAIIELLSIRKAYDLYHHHCTKLLHVEPDDKGVWLRSIMPVVLKTVSEVAQLLQILVRHSSSTRSRTVQVAPIVTQVAETISDISTLTSNSLPSDGANSANLFYDALDQCGRLFAAMLSISSAAPLPPDIVCRLLNAAAMLLDPEHPRLFRLSFVRVIPTIICCSPGGFPKDTSVDSNVMAIGVSIWTAYDELCNLQPVDPSVMHRRKESFLPNLRRLGFALHSLVSFSQSASFSLCEHRHGAVQRVIEAISKSFAAIRMMGGFGVKSTRSGDDAFLLELCESVQMHCLVLSGLFAQSERAKSLARKDQLLAVFANNWNCMRAASRRGSKVLITTLRLLQNFIHSNEENKTSLATTFITIQPTPGGNERNLLALIGELAIGGSGTTSLDERWSSTAGSILKSAFLHLECLHSGIKTGLVSKLFDVVVNRSRLRRETTKTQSPQEEQTLIELIGVLASVASSDEGRQMLLQMREMRDLLEDIFHFPEGSKLLMVGVLFVRNMAFSKLSKSHFSVWEPVVSRVLTVLYRIASQSTADTVDDTPRMISADHLSTALLCFVHDNQRAQSVMQSSREQMTVLRDAAQAWRRIAQDPQAKDSRRAVTVKTNLESVTVLVTTESDSNNRKGD